MSNLRTYTRSFAGGEVTPEFWGQITDGKYQTGLATCRNFEVMPHGPVRNRAGFQFVHRAKYPDRQAHLLPFVYSTTQTMVLEFGSGYIRFHTTGGTLLAPAAPAYNNATAYVVGDLVSSGGVTYYCQAVSTGNAPPSTTYWYAQPASGEYEVPTPYQDFHVFDIHYVQSADVMTLAHPGYVSRELRRLGATRWTCLPVSFSSALGTPTGVGAVALPAPSPGTATTQSYVVTAVSADGLDESPASSPPATCSNCLYDTGASNTVSWSAVSGASLYNVYRLANGLYGYIGQTASLSMVDQGGGDVVTPDVGKTPPIAENPFTSTGNFPGAVSYYEQRRAFAGTVNAPSTMWMTKSGTESNMSYSLPTLDNDRIKFRVAAREANTIRHIVPLQQMLLLTSSAEWRVTSVNSDALTPASVSVKPQSYVGANNVQPVIVNNNMLYVAARGGHVRELGYNWQSNGYVTGDTSLRAPHLFDGLDVVAMTTSKTPHPVVWAVSSNGKLLGLTYVPEQEIGAWHQHDTDGWFESVAAVPEGAEDVLYAVVRRTIGGTDVRYIEFMRSRRFATLADSFLVDCGLSYSGAPVTSVSGLQHLEGKTVSILADGAVMPQQVVTAGAVSISQPASKISVGLPITADLQTLPPAIEGDRAFGQDRPMNVNKIWLRVFESSGIFAGPTFDRLVEHKQRSTETYGTPPDRKTQRVQIDVKPSWGDNGQICLRQSDPLPLTVLNMTVEVSLGGG